MAIQNLLLCTILSLKGAQKAPGPETQSIPFEADIVKIAGEKKHHHLTSQKSQINLTEKQKQHMPKKNSSNRLKQSKKPIKEWEKRIAKCHWRQLGGMGKAEEHNNTSRTEEFQFRAALPLQIFGLCLCL